MKRMISCLFLFALAATVLLSQSQAPAKLSAPTYYIAASAELRGPEEILVKGASNLPAGTVLFVNVSDFVGQGSKILSAGS